MLPKQELDQNSHQKQQRILYMDQALFQPESNLQT
ncbi:hypothetical protein SDC9_179417 [bioreactor metagenome]|uniref:Uncharacterized protein n=1 Tax=bioreactor metagenome TaxID=1076179 RepID=A0A645H0V4_9ZZZZ